MTEPSLPKVGEDLITIRIDDKNFTANQALLSLSSFYFADLFNPNKYTQPKDKIYQVNGKSDLFPYILQFCETGSFPLFFSEKEGFDHSKYSALLIESIRFGVKQLSDWIKLGKYNNTVKTIITSEREFINFDECQCYQHCFESSEFVSGIHYYDTPVIQYKSPRDTAIHHGHPRKYGKQCENAMGEEGPNFERVSKVAMVVSTKTFQINYKVLMPGFLLLSEEPWNA